MMEESDSSDVDHSNLEASSSTPTNSFMKKVTSRVTGLFPQSFTKWFSPSEKRVRIESQECIMRPRKRQKNMIDASVSTECPESSGPSTTTLFVNAEQTESSTTQFQMNGNVTDHGESFVYEQNSSTASVIPLNKSKRRKRALYFTEQRFLPKKPCLSSRSPSFNVSSFGSKSFVDRSYTTGRVINSPFYNGRTKFGGSSAICKRKETIEVKPAEEPSDKDSNITLSKTALRILETLEHFSTPLDNARKIPKVNEVNNPNLIRKSQASKTQLLVPTVPELLRMKMKKRLQDSTERMKNHVLKKVVTSQSDIFHGKVKSKTDISEVAEPVVLPEVRLPLSKLPQFDISVPPPMSTFEFSSPIKVTEATTLQAANSTQFEFSSPIRLNLTNNNNELKKSDEKNNSNANNNKTNEIKTATTKPDAVVTEDLMAKFKPAAGTWECDMCMVRNKAEKTICDACTSPKPGSKIPPSTPQVTETTKPTTTISGDFKDIIKKQNSNWECPCCSVRNPNEKSKCVCCETPNPNNNNNASSKSESIPAKNETKGPVFQFGIPNTQAAVPASTGFTFGVKNDLKTDSSSNIGFQFGIDKAQISSPSTFKFGISASTCSTSTDSTQKAVINSQSCPDIIQTATNCLDNKNKNTTDTKDIKSESCIPDVTTNDTNTAKLDDKSDTKNNIIIHKTESELKQINSEATIIIRNKNEVSDNKFSFGTNSRLKTPDFSLNYQDKYLVYNPYEAPAPTFKFNVQQPETPKEEPQTLLNSVDTPVIKEVAEKDKSNTSLIPDLLPLDEPGTSKQPDFPIFEFGESEIQPIFGFGSANATDKIPIFPPPNVELAKPFSVSSEKGKMPLSGAHKIKSSTTTPEKTATVPTITTTLPIKEKTFNMSFNKEPLFPANSTDNDNKPVPQSEIAENPPAFSTTTVEKPAGFNFKTATSISNDASNLFSFAKKPSTEPAAPPVTFSFATAFNNIQKSTTTTNMFMPPVSADPKDSVAKTTASPFVNSFKTAAPSTAFGQASTFKNAASSTVAPPVFGTLPKTAPTGFKDPAKPAEDGLTKGHEIVKQTAFNFGTPTQLPSTFNFGAPKDGAQQANGSFNFSAPVSTGFNFGAPTTTASSLFSFTGSNNQATSNAAPAGSFSAAPPYPSNVNVNMKPAFNFFTQSRDPRTAQSNNTTNQQPARRIRKAFRRVQR